MEGEISYGWQLLYIDNEAKRNTTSIYPSATNTYKSHPPWPWSQGVFRRNLKLDCTEGFPLKHLIPIKSTQYIIIIKALFCSFRK